MSAAILDDLQSRQLIAQLTAEDALQVHLASGPQTVYSGFDPTADSLHIGSLVPLLALRRFQLAGHSPIILVGGATGLIGDPSFKAEERKLNSADTVAKWVDRIQHQTAQFVDFGATANPAKVVNNLDWTAGIDLLDFLRDTGKHFSVNNMIQKESVKQRLVRDGAGISFTEFTYMILQSYDFAELYQRHGCSVQIGGSDQWGNITGGIDLTRRLHQAQVFGATLPLVTKADGTKFGKTESGTVWLDPAKTSTYAFYQFWMNTADEDAYRFLRFFTFLSLDAIEEIERSDAKIQGRKQVQSLLATEVTRLVHGDQGLAAAKRISDALFSGELNSLAEADFAQLALDGLPCTEVQGSGAGLAELLVDSGVAVTPRGDVTLGQARKFINSNAIAVNGTKITDETAQLKAKTGYFGRYHLIKRGKKVFHLLQWR
ncbi:MAG: tyrosine--tRNA ligase [Cellvibrionales bacterium]|nr:tyrosine--tRNA ligase [Cellvibrionales bacterium]|tara:strand:+ start:6715 stop:8007 length:1293 start_codon:yes stop_codon:yes gene_type:complete